MALLPARCILFGPRLRYSGGVATTAPRAFFPGLNGLRCIAALMVVVQHAELYKWIVGAPSLFMAPGFHPWLLQMGAQGVEIFFVLSGFLVTYLLLHEQESQGRIRVLRFYLRRMLRIWPLYFLMVALGFFVLPHFGYPSELHVKLAPYFGIKLLLMVCFFPNLVLSVFGVVFPVFPLWSIGTEEQFYLIWPHLLAWAQGRWLRSLFVFMAICVALKAAAAWGLTHSAAMGPRLVWKSLFDALRFDAMAWGGVAACLVQQRRTAVLKIVYRHESQAAALALTLALWGWNPDLGACSDLVYGGLYAVLIVNIATNPNTWLRPVHRLLDAGGRISYGIYVYHTPLLFALLYLLKPKAQAWYFQPVFYLAGFSATFAVAALSYRYFEAPILALKSRFAADAD